MTAGEVAFAEDHPGQCVIGIVSGIEVDDTGQVRTASGHLRILPWHPDDEDLMPVTFRWSVPDGDEPPLQV